MSHLKALPDPVDAAIAAASEPPPVRLAQVQVTIASTGRPAVIAIPDDATDAEIAELCGWMLTTLMGSLRERRTTAASGRILLPS